MGQLGIAAFAAKRIIGRSQTMMAATRASPRFTCFFYRQHNTTTPLLKKTAPPIATFDDAGIRQKTVFRPAPLILATPLVATFYQNQRPE